MEKTGEINYDFLQAAKKGTVFERLYQRRRVQKIVDVADYSNKKILDLGCDTGIVSFPIKKKYPNANLTGLEISKWCISKLKKHYAKQKIYFNSIIGSGFNLPFKDFSFDIVILADVIEHIPDKNAFVKEIQRIMKKNGKIIVTTPWRFNPVWYDFHIRKLFSGRKNIDKEDIVHEAFDKRRIMNVFKKFKLEKYSVYCYFGQIIAIFRKNH